LSFACVESFPSKFFVCDPAMGTNFLYSTWKRELLQRVSSADAQPLSSPRSAQVPNRPLSSRPQSARWRCDAPRNPLPRTPVRPMSARVGREALSCATAAAQRSALVKASQQIKVSAQGESRPGAVPTGAPCRSLVDADRHFREGQFGVCREELQRLGVSGSLPRCCVPHKLLVARVALLSEEPKRALALYDAILPGSVPDGEWNCANTTVFEFGTASQSRQSEMLNAIVDAFAISAPSIAAYFVARRARCCMSEGNLDEALALITRASRFCPTYCDSTTCKWLLEFALDEECSLQHCTLPPDDCGCSDHTHLFCQASRTLLTRLLDLLKKSRTHSSTTLSVLAADFVSYCHSPHPPRVPEALLHALVIRVHHAMLVQAPTVEVKVTALNRHLCTSQVFSRREAQVRLQLLQNNPAQAFRFLRDNAEKFPRKDELQRKVALRFMRQCCRLDATENDAFGFGICSDKSLASLSRHKRHLSLALHPDKWSGNQESADVAQYCFRWMADEFDRVCRT
jgi:hypothetical protein